jgi:DNA-binding transcriptional ArsR family regulator
LKRYQDITDPSIAKALAHPLRTRILAALENRTASPTELAGELDAPLGVVSYHVRRLHALRFLKLVKRVPRRGAVEHYYTTIAGPRITDEAWRATPTIVKQATITAALAELGSQASAAVGSGGFDSPTSHLTRTPVTVDDQGWRELSRELSALLPRIQKIEAESHKRLLKNDHQDEQRATVGLMLFAPEVAVPAAPPAPARRRQRSRSASASGNGRIPRAD